MIRGKSAGRSAETGTAPVAPESSSSAPTPEDGGPRARTGMAEARVSRVLAFDKDSVGRPAIQPSIRMDG